MTLVNPFLLKLMKERPIMMHNSYFAYRRIRFRTPFGIVEILSAILLMWVRTFKPVLPKKIPLTNCLSKAGWNDFLSRCLSEFDHGKISEIQVPLSKSELLSTCCAGLC